MRYFKHNTLGDIYAYEDSDVALALSIESAEASVSAAFERLSSSGAVLSSVNHYLEMPPKDWVSARDDLEIAKNNFSGMVRPEPPINVDDGFDFDKYYKDRDAYDNAEITLRNAESVFSEYKVYPEIFSSLTVDDIDTAKLDYESALHYYHAAVAEYDTLSTQSDELIRRYGGTLDVIQNSRELIGQELEDFLNPPVTDEQIKAEVLADRDNRLAFVDSKVSNPLIWMGFTPEQQQALFVYRNSLVSIESQEGFPHDVVFPDVPDFLGS